MDLQTISVSRYVILIMLGKQVGELILCAVLDEAIFTLTLLLVDNSLLAWLWAQPIPPT